MKLRVGVLGLGSAWESRHRPALRALLSDPDPWLRAVAMKSLPDEAVPFEAV